ncbi:MAG TPA: SCE4755 family polysaccharide monooxygenase-like protein [Polyangiales bacterium]|nr:SCE4755 family polysaccharide monooxygenase-like protein [Polyangiales bacterium]
MEQSTSTALAAAFALAAVTFSAVPAHAHINMSGALKSRGGDQKNFPCDGKRGDGPTYTFEPGATITLTVDEAIPHPSYFRIAFDDDGDDAFVEPKSIKPIDPARRCPFDANDKCGESDYCNVMSTSGGASVLWDNLEPHMAGSIKSYTFTVKLPDVECENCTIQVLQIMEDTVHGAYCPSDSCMDTSLEDIYHRCIDITLKKGATNSPGTSMAAADNKGMDCIKMAGGGTAGSGAAGTAGGTAGGAAGAAAGAGGTTGAAGATAAAGSSAAGTSGSAGTSAAAGSKAAAGSPASSAAGATGSTPSTAAGRGGSPAVGMMQNPTTTAPLAGAASDAPAPGASNDSGGCSITQGRSPNRAAAAWLVVAAALGLARTRRRRARSHQA